MKKQLILEESLERIPPSIKVENLDNQTIQLGGTFGKVQLKTKVVNYVTTAQAIPLIQQLQGKRNQLIIAERISDEVKIMLQEVNINYLEESGNCFIKENNFFILVEGKKYISKKNKEVVNIFSENGVKLIFQLFNQPELLNLPQRIIAITASVSLGSVPKLLNGLEKLSFLKKRNKKEKILIKKENLLSRWVTAYNEKVKPKYFRGYYRFILKTDFQNWEKIALPEGSFWGGEPAARLLTQALTPEILTLYTNMERRELLKMIKIVPDPQGNIEVFEVIDGIQPANMPLIIYADLLSSSDSRNREVATKIYDAYVKQLID